MLQPSKPQAQMHIRRAISEVSDFISRNPKLDVFVQWRRDATIAVASAFGRDSRQVREFSEISFGGFEAGGGTILDVTTFRNGLSMSRGILRSMLNEMEQSWQDDRQPQLIPQSREIAEQQVSNRVFVVHGRDGGSRDTVAKFLGNLGLEVTILQEQPNQGRTIIEKFEDYSDVGFAVVLCTPDDIGTLASEPDNLRFRPRQNVILELGYFWGALGRPKVCALIDGEIEMPSDYNGVGYIPLDESDDWKSRLTKELESAGLALDKSDLG